MLSRQEHSAKNAAKREVFHTWKGKPDKLNQPVYDNKKYLFQNSK